MMQYSKLIGMALGAVLGFGASKGLPADLAGPDMQNALSVVLGLIFAWRFPANKPPSA